MCFELLRPGRLHDHLRRRHQLARRRFAHGGQLLHGRLDEGSLVSRCLRWRASRLGGAKRLVDIDRSHQRDLANLPIGQRQSIGSHRIALAGNRAAGKGHGRSLRWYPSVRGHLPPDRSLVHHRSFRSGTPTGGRASANAWLAGFHPPKGGPPSGYRTGSGHTDGWLAAASFALRREQRSVSDPAIARPVRRSLLVATRSVRQPGLSRSSHRRAGHSARALQQHVGRILADCPRSARNPFLHEQYTDLSRPPRQHRGHRTRSTAAASALCSRHRIGGRGHPDFPTCADRSGEPEPGGDTDTWNDQRRRQP